MILTDREMQIIRLVEAGIPLRPRPGKSHGALFDFARTPANVLGPTLHALVRKELVEYDKDAGRYRITDNGREYVALRTRVRDFANQDT
jgi:DNA-binding IclR family transcriptional regulator